MTNKPTNGLYCCELPPQVYLRQCFSYCPESGKLYWLPRPREHFDTDHGMLVSNGRDAGKEAGTPAGNGYITVGVNGIRYKAHRLIWKYWYGDEPEIVDHINHRRDDNKIQNLRSITHQENVRHRNPDIGIAMKSGVTGVNWDKSDQAWRARIWVHGKMINLGKYKDLEKAIEARRSAEQIYGL